MIFLAKFLILSKRLITAFFIGLVYRPGKVILRWFFYAIVVKGYRFYLAIIKRLGWSDGIRRNPFAFILNQKLVHVIVAVLTISIIAMNATAKTQTVSAEEMVGKTFLSGIVSGEFDAETDELIEEYFDEEFEIVDIIEGSGNRSGMAGSLRIKSKKGIIFNSGIRGGEEYYKQLLQDKQKLIGKLATIRYQEKTEEDIPRFPVAVQIDRSDI